MKSRAGRPLTGRPAVRPGEWLDLVEINGPFLTPPVIKTAWPAGLDGLSRAVREQLRVQHSDWLAAPDRNREKWIRWVLTNFLSWGGLLGFDDAVEDLALDVPEHGESVVPTFAFKEADEQRPLLLGLVCPSSDSLTARVAGSTWSASYADRLAYAMRRHQVPLGLVCDGRWWILVWAQEAGPTTTVVFDAALWLEERQLAEAFVSLLGRRRFLNVALDETLSALLEQSKDAPDEITDALGKQVRRAVELLVDSIGRAEAASAQHGGKVGMPRVDAHEVYLASVTVAMRLIFLLFAEERGLLPNDHPDYQEYYSASRLVDELRALANELGEDELAHSTSGWHRLLAIARGLHTGAEAGTLVIPAYDGGLFDPDKYPWLEGRAHAGENTDIDVLAVDDRTVLHALESVQYVVAKGERRRLTFRAIDVEQIGYVYERLLGYDARRATCVVVGLIGRPGDEEEVALEELEQHALKAEGDADALAERMHVAFKDSGIGGAKTLARKLAPLGVEEQDARRLLLAVTNGDIGLTTRLMPFFRLIRKDLRELPVVVLPGGMYVTRSARGAVGAHYTPRTLAAEVVEGALQPLVYSPGPLQTADQSRWKLRPAREILQLKIADIAVGSGAFLVAACRYLGDRVVEAWARDGETSREQYPTPAATDPEGDRVVEHARFLVATRCLYGVDIDPLAVQMARLSLWLLTPSAPFAFLDDRIVCGDSLLGITSLEQVEWMHISPQRGRELHEGSLLEMTAGIRELVEKAALWRRDIREIQPGGLEALREKRALLRDAQDVVGPALACADLVAGATLAGMKAGWRRVDQLSVEAASHACRVLEDPERPLADARMAAWRWLRTDLPGDAFKREPLHWPLVFPEVFLDGGGFDGIIGNPPFRGGQKLTGVLGDSYREYLVEVLGRGVRGSADLVAYFVLRAHQVLNGAGQSALIATNTLAQGDTREVGLDQIVADGFEIRQAVKTERWPTKAVALHYCVVCTSKSVLSVGATRRLDGVAVSGITSSLDCLSRVSGKPFRLISNAGMAFQGATILGLGFTVPLEEADDLIRADVRNADALYPYLNGEDLNTRPDCSARRWAVNFHDWPVERAKCYPRLWQLVESQVKPDRMKNSRKVYRDHWWHYAEKRPAMLKAVEGLGRVMVIALVSKVVMPVFVPGGQVYSHMLGVIATDDSAMLGLLSSAPHYWWAITHASTMKGDLRYTPSDVLETLVRPELTYEMRELGEALHQSRNQLMIGRNLGLTKTYNLVHDPNCRDLDIVGLRESHRQIDHAVANAYGWQDIELDHDFYETRQGVRYTVGPAVRQEILDRLLKLNHERYAQEVQQGLHEKKRGKRARPVPGQGQLFEFDVDGQS